MTNRKGDGPKSLFWCFKLIEYTEFHTINRYIGFI